MCVYWGQWRRGGGETLVLGMCGYIWFIKFQNVDELQGLAKETFWAGGLVETGSFRASLQAWAQQPPAMLT